MTALPTNPSNDAEGAEDASSLAGLTPPSSPTSALPSSSRPASPSSDRALNMGVGAQMRLAHTYLLIEEVERALAANDCLPAAVLYLQRARSAVEEAQREVMALVPTKGES